MKIYDFILKEREAGRVVFALVLIKTRKRLAERIIIGRENEVRLLLNGGDSNVYYDKIRPVGSFLFNFEADPNGVWHKHLETLRNNRPRKPLFNMSRWKKVAPVSEFLTDKYNSSEPSAVFAAIRTWEDYLNFYPMKDGQKLLNDHLFMLYKPFQDYTRYRPWHKDAVDALAIALRDGESQVELWYPVAKRPFETAVVFSSLLPIISYYLTKMNDWKLVFQECKVCGKDFAAPSRHYALCSDKCRKKNAVTAKHDYNERIKDDETEPLYKTAYQYWYNCWRKVKNGKAVNVDAAAFKVAFDDFRKEAGGHKKVAKKAIKVEEDKKQSKAEKEKAIRKILDEFNGWLLKQQSLANKLMGY